MSEENEKPDSDAVADKAAANSTEAPAESQAETPAPQPTAVVTADDEKNAAFEASLAEAAAPAAAAAVLPEMPKMEEPKEEPKKEELSKEPKAEAPKEPEAPVAEAPKEPKPEEAKTEEAKPAETKAEEPEANKVEAKAEEAKAPEAEEQKKEEPKAAAPAKSKQPEPPGVEDEEGKNWYVVQAFSGYEARVQRTLKEHAERAGLLEHFGEILVPTEEVVEIRGGQKRKSERKFFPGYVLVQMELNDETWHLVKSVPRVLGFIGGTADRPAPITAKEADSILQRVQDGADKPRPKVLFDVGEVVRVTDGPFNDFNGVVEEVNFEKNKLLVAVQIFGRSTPVELEFSQVEKA